MPRTPDAKSSKTCGKCLSSKALSDYRLNRSGKSYRTTCRSCENEAKRVWHQANREEQNKKCANYYKENQQSELARAAAYRKVHREERAARQRERYWSDPEKGRRIVREWISRHPEEYRLRNRLNASKRRAASAGVLNPKEVLEQMERFNNRCFICDGPFEHIDHWKPLARGGLHVLDNLRPLCQSCNNQKYATWPLTTERLAEIRTRSIESSR